jgi:LytS/YehU family sensor histidine kinase
VEANTDLPFPSDSSNRKGRGCYLSAQSRQQPRLFEHFALLPIVFTALRSPLLLGIPPGSRALSLRHMGDRLFLSLCDEGVGFDPSRLEKPGLGILSMQGRARLLGGEFEIRSTPAKGTRIEAWVPLEPVADRLNV